VYQSFPDLADPNVYDVRVTSTRPGRRTAGGARGGGESRHHRSRDRSEDFAAPDDQANLRAAAVRSDPGSEQARRSTLHMLHETAGRRK
jgi:hypothetical protein